VPYPCKWQVMSFNLEEAHMRVSVLIEGSAPRGSDHELSGWKDECTWNEMGWKQDVPYHPTVI
jgi:hypothetical protein